MSNKVLKFGSECRKKMLEGIDLVKQAVVSTLGPSGTNVVFGRGTSHPIITKDGVSVAREINFSDKYMQTGASIIKEAAEKTNSIAGDGTTTTILLASELAAEGNRLVDTGLPAVELQKGMDVACEEVKKALDNYKKVVDDEDDILHVATISANNDEEVGKIVQEAFTGIGEGGQVNIMDSHSKSGKTTVKFADGIEIPTGICSSKFITDLRSEKMIIDNPYIILTTLQVDLDDIIEPLNIAFKKSWPIVIVGSECGDELLVSLEQQVRSKKFKGGFINAPGFNEYSKEEQLTDLAIALGTKVITTNDELKQFCKDVKAELDVWGHCDQIVSTTTRSSFIGTKGKEEEINKRVEELKNKITSGQNDDNIGISEEEISSIKGRIARLTGGFATILVGGLTETRIKELKDRYEDAVHAVQAAISDGIVPGGGCALLKAAKEVSNNYKFKDTDTVAFKEGFKAVLTTCRKPAIRIMENVTNDYSFIIGNIEHNLEKKTLGYDAKHTIMCDDMFESGIIDPVKVTKTALSYATSVAGIFITTNCIIVDEAPNVGLTPNDPILERNDPTYGGGY